MKKSLFRLRSGLSVVILVAALVVAAQAPATADETKKLAPNTLVSSDGTITDPATLRLPANLTAVAAKRGTGNPAGTGADLSAGKGGKVVGGVSTQSIIGTDDRYRTTPTNWWPATATVQLTYVSGSSTIQYCTGWLIGDDTVITAGHCVYNNNTNTWYSGRGVRAWPARDGNTAPYGSCTVASFHSVVGWTTDENPEYDYGALKLNCTVGTATGTFGFWWQSASLNGTSTYVRGYPCDKPFGEQWASYDQVRSTATRRVYYNNDTWNCHSGSPVYSYSSSFCSGPCALAIHAYGGSSNSGTRITEGVFNNLIYWRDL